MYIRFFLDFPCFAVSLLFCLTLHSPIFSMLFVVAGQPVLSSATRSFVYFRVEPTTL